jgi:hypothetical protein
VMAESLAARWVPELAAASAGPTESASAAVMAAQLALQSAVAMVPLSESLPAVLLAPPLEFVTAEGSARWWGVLSASASAAALDSALVDVWVAG